MTLHIAYFECVPSESPAKKLNQTLALARRKFHGTEHRIINVETVEPKTFMGFQLKAGGIRVWYEAEAEVTAVEAVQQLFEQINS